MPSPSLSPSTGPGVGLPAIQLAGSLPYSSGLTRWSDAPLPSAAIGHGGTSEYFTRSTRMYGTKPASGSGVVCGVSGLYNSMLSPPLSSLPLYGPKIGVPGSMPYLARNAPRVPGSFTGSNKTTSNSPFGTTEVFGGKLN